MSDFYKLNDYLIKDKKGRELIETNKYVYIVDNSISVDELQAIINLDKPKKIVFTTGEYTFDKQIVLKSNTILNFNNSIINSNFRNEYGDNILFSSYKADDVFTGYDGNSNIELYDGIFNTTFTFMHSKNVKIINCEFRDNILVHSMQIAGCKNFIVDNCSFSGSVLNDEKIAKSELIQLDMCEHLCQPYCPEDSLIYDGTINETIIISNCKFNTGDNVSNRFYTAIGTHTGYDDMKEYNQNIIIKNNIFDNPYYSAINLVGVKNCLIENNTFNQDGQESDGNSSHIICMFQNSNVTINNNEIDGGRCFLNSKTYDGTNYALQNNFKITNNNFGIFNDVNPLSIIKAFYMKNLIIRNNSVKQFLSSFFRSTSADNENIDISNNIFYQNESGGIAIKLYGGTNYNITNNIFYNTNSNPVVVNDNESSIINIYNNKLTQPLNLIQNPEKFDLAKVGNLKIELASGIDLTSVNNMALNYPANKFDKLLLVFGYTHSRMIVEILPYVNSNKMICPQSYGGAVRIPDGTTGVFYLTLNEDNTFNYLGDLDLRSIYGVNN